MSERLKKKTRDTRLAGFSLVEALATLVLVAIVLPAAMRGITLALSTGSHTVRRTEAIELAQSKLAELVATGGWQETDLAGDFSETPSGESLTTDSGRNKTDEYRWEATVEDFVAVETRHLHVEDEDVGQRPESRPTLEFPNELVTGRDEVEVDLEAAVLGRHAEQHLIVRVVLGHDDAGGHRDGFRPDGLLSAHAQTFLQPLAGMADFPIDRKSHRLSD